MKLIFLIKSATVDITNYTIKDIPGSSGRLDVISRCVLSALIANDSFEKSVQIWVFLDKYGTFVFDTELLNYDKFPKNELLFSDNFVDLIKRISRNAPIDINPLNSVQVLDLDILTAMIKFKEKELDTFVLREDGADFSEFFSNYVLKNDIVFIIGNQVGDFLDSKELLRLNLPNLSVGNKSYLASSVIRLVKLHILK